MGISATPGASLAYLDPANDEPGPTMSPYGVGLLDNRSQFTYSPGQAAGSKTYGWMGTDVVAIDQAPSTISAVNIAAAQAAVSGTPMTLVAASGAGITINTTITNAATGKAVTGLRAIDAAMGSVGFGPSATIQLWDPGKSVARNVRITTNADDTGGFYTVAGYDIYGFPMSERITGVSSGVAAGKKAFKYIASVTPSGTIASTLASVGTGDVYGLPIRVDRLPYTTVWWNNAANPAGTFVAADATSPATTTTGDVRGTYLVPSASDGTKRLVVFIALSPASSQTTITQYGVTQV